MVRLRPPKVSPDTIHGVTWTDQQFLQQEIAKAERMTQSEIILGVAKRSSNYDFIALVLAVGIVFPLATLVLYLKLWPFSFTVLQLAQIVLVISLQTFFVKSGWVIGAVPKTHIHRTAHRMANDLFYDYDLQSTHQRNALLIFVSVQERTLILLPDKALRQKVPYQVWQDVVEHALQQKSKENLTHWLAHTVQVCAKVLHRYDPATEVNENEISNHIRFI